MEQPDIVHKKGMVMGFAAAEGDTIRGNLGRPKARCESVGKAGFAAGGALLLVNLRRQCSWRRAGSS